MSDEIKVGIFSVSLDRTRSVVTFHEGAQYVASYQRDTIMGVRGGLCLDLSEPAWRLTADDVRAVQAWLRLA